MPKKHPSVIDLFAGAGGFSAGFSKAGFQVVAALENVACAAATHSTNFPTSKTVLGDIQELTPKQFGKQALLTPGSVDVIIGGPPCQTYSTIGVPKIRHVKKGDVQSDPRNYLFKYFFDYISYFRPKYFVLENVPQLKTKYSGRLYHRILEEAHKIGYSTSSEILNAVDFGVPQSRRRLFVVGTLGRNTFEFPTPIFAPPSGAGANRQRSWRTVGDALDDLPIIFDGCRFGPLPYSGEALNDYQAGLRSPSGLVGNNVCRVSNERAKKIFPYMKPGERYMDLPPRVRRILPFREDIFFDRLKRLKHSEPSWTVLAHIGMDGYMYIHPKENRTLSVREAARLQAFDDEFNFLGNMREQYVQVGNSVPPPLSAAIATEIREALAK